MKARSQRDTCAPMFTVALITIAKGWKRWINKVWYVHTLHYSALKRKEILIHVITWMNPEDIMLSKISQA